MVMAYIAICIDTYDNQKQASYYQRLFTPKKHARVKISTTVLSISDVMHVFPGAYLSGILSFQTIENNLV